MRIGTVAALLLLVLNVHAQTKTLIGPHQYHVAINGDDANPGTSLKPFKTIMAAAKMAMPGDTVTVHAGVYREQVVPPRGGNSDAERILYQAAKGERVVIKGSEQVRYWKRDEGDVWMTIIPNSFFKNFNPFKEYINGDWFWPEPKDRKYLRGAVYLNGDWLMEAQKKEDVFKPAIDSNLLWFATVDAESTRIWAQFNGKDPNQELVEVNARETVFYPDQPFINFLTIRGFIMEQAATNWAPPTAEQMGLIGTHWSRGWIIEDNTVRYSKCVGISLGKYGDEWDNKSAEAAEGYVGTINRALRFGWNKSTVGGHVVRRNKVAYCEQAGIVGSMGCSFSIIEKNEIHDIHIRRLFGGAEMAGIKFHGAVDVQLRGNYIYRTNMGIWLDWMAQGTRVSGNLMHDNLLDVFLEVNRGPTILDNNILLSNVSVLMNSSGVAFAHNLFGGAINVVAHDSRLTPVLKPHSTYVTALHDNPAGDVQFYNNLYVMKGNSRQYDKSILPVTMSGNVYTKGTNEALPADYFKKWGNVNDSLLGLLREKKEELTLDVPKFETGVRLTHHANTVKLEINLDRTWSQRIKRKLVSSELLTEAVIPVLRFDDPDGSRLILDRDYFGKSRSKVNPFPGPFEPAPGSTRQVFKVW